MASIVGLDDFTDALIKVGYDLVKPHSSTEELLTLLDEAESLLRTVGQDQPLSMQNALIPSKDGLVSAGLLNHPDSDVRVSVVSCLTELVRITAPEAPYDDDQMKEVFRLTVEAFEKLADLSSRSYKKVESVLDSVSRVRSCLVMLDLECYDLILQMFRNFLKIIRSDHSQEVFSAMEMIMITTVDETEDVFPDLLDTLLTSVKKENQTVSPVSWSLAEKVLSRCACRLKPYIIEALKTTGTSLDMYSPVVTTICESVHDTPKVHNVVNTKETEAAEPELGREVALRDSLEENLDFGNARKEARSKSGSKRPARDGTVRVNVNDKVKNGNSSNLLKEMRSESTDAEAELGVSGKRGRKPNSLMNPEDYDISWLSGKRDSVRKGSGGESSLRKKRPLPKETSPATTSRARKRSRVKIDESDHDLDSLSSPRLKKLASCFRDEVPREKESNEEESDEIPEDDRKIGTSSKKTRSQNGLEKSQKKKPIVEAKIVNSSGKRSSARSSAKRKSASLDTPVPQSSKSKKMVSQIAEESEETSKSHSTRRRTTRKEEESGTNELGKDLVGKRVKIWWPLDKMYYEGVVESYSSRKKTHLVVYLDGDSEALNLAKERWELLEEEDHNSASEEDMETDLPESVPLIDLMQRPKLKKCKSMSVSVEPTSSSGVRSSGRSVTKKGSGKKGKKQAKRGKGGSKAVAVKNLKSMKELNDKTERTEEQEVDDDNEGDESEKQEQSEDKSEEEECLKLTDAETKEEEKQSPNSEAASERDGSGSEEEPKWRETDDMEDEEAEEREEVADEKGTNPSSSEKEEEEDEEKVMEDEAEEMVDDKGTNTSLSDTEKEEDESEEREEVNGTNTNMSEIEKEEDEERDMEEVNDKEANISLSETEKEEGEDKEMEEVADEREDVIDKVTTSNLSEIETEKEEGEERDMEAEAEEREEVGGKTTKTNLSEIEKEEDEKKDMENKAEETEEMVDDKGTNKNLSEIEKEGEMEDEAEDREEVDDKVSKTNLSETEKEEDEERVMEDEAEEVNDKGTNTSLPETEKEEGEEKEMEDEAEEKEKVDDKVVSTNLSEIEKEEEEEERRET